MRKICFIIFFLPFNISAQSWYPMNVGVTNGLGNAVVSGITDYQGKITIGGYFKKSGTNTLNGIAQWNGAQWQGMGIGFWITASPDSSGNSGFGMATYNGKLYCGGVFEGAGGTIINDPLHKANGIAKWDVTDWFPMTQPDDGVNSSCTALQVYNGNLYLGGFFSASFDSAGVHGTQGIAKWNDTVFSSVGQFYGNFPPGNYDAVLDFTLYDDKLIAGGYFTTIDTFPYGTYSCIAVWNDTVWSSLSTGFNDGVFALTVFNGELYAGGKFTATGDNLTSLNHIAKWDGIQWTAVGEGFDDVVTALCVDSINNKLIAGGEFTQTGLGQPAKHIAEWNGTNWQELGGGTNDNVWALFAKDSNLYVGGEFTEAGSVPANCIAVWGNNTVGINDLSLFRKSIIIYPNPSNGIFTIEILSKNFKTMTMLIYDVLGNVVYQSVIADNKINVDITNLPSGIYSVNLSNSFENYNGTFIKN